jgi:hypothetical protein
MTVNKNIKNLANLVYVKFIQYPLHSEGKTNRGLGINEKKS